jgi:hypothetical protein
MLVFVEGEMLAPILLHKAEESVGSEQASTLDSVEFA